MSVDGNELKEYTPPIFEHPEARRVNNPISTALSVSGIDNIVTPKTIRTGKKGAEKLKDITTTAETKINRTYARRI